MDVLIAFARNLDGPVLAVFVGWLIWRTTRMDSRDGSWVHEELAQLRERLARLEARERSWLSLLSVHASWDARAAAAIQRVDSTALATLGEPPPLYPPDHSTAGGS